MGTSYTRDATVEEMAADRIRRIGGDMHRYGVRVGVLMAYNPSGPAVKHGGYAANATIKVVALKDRVTKGYDAEMLIDSTAWDGFYHEQRLALIAHEIEHLRLVKRRDRETGCLIVQTDDIGRPKLKTVPGDWNAGDGFRSIVREFGDSAIEFANIETAWMHAQSARDAGPESPPAPEPTLFDGTGEAEGGEHIREEVPASLAPYMERAAEKLQQYVPVGGSLTVTAGDRSMTLTDSVVQADPDLWKSFPMERWTRFGLTAADVRTLADGRTRTGEVHPIATVGDLSHFSSDPARPGRGFRDLKGFGAAAVDRLSEAESRFWSWWRSSGELAFAEERGTADGAPRLAGTRSPHPVDGDRLAGPGDAEFDPKPGPGFDLVAAIEAAEEFRREPAHEPYTKGW